VTVATVGLIYYVHHDQTAERKRMRARVLVEIEEEKIAAKKKENNK